MIRDGLPVEGTWRDERGYPWRFWLEFAELDGTFRPIALMLGPAADETPPLTQSHLRAFPLAEMVRRALSPGANLFRTDQPFRNARELVDPSFRTPKADVRRLNAVALRERLKGLTVEQRKELRERAKKLQRSLPPQRGGSPTRGVGYYQQVAEVYLSAKARGLPPLRAVMAKFGLGKSTAATHVGRARKLDFIPPYEETSK